MVSHQRSAIASFTQALLATFCLGLESSTRENHFCIQTEPCKDYTKFYFNWLACDCFAIKQCDKECIEPTEILQPNAECGECITKQRYKSFFPDWATDEDI